MNHRTDFWTPAQEAELLRICQHSHRAAEIARLLAPVRSGTSRNAVIGKIERLRRKGHQIETGPPGGGYPNQNKPGKRRKVRKIRQVLTHFVTEEPPVSTPPPPRRGLEPRDKHGNRILPDIPMRRLTLMQLGPCTCRWPVGDEPPFTFCGNDTTRERSYCAAHHQFAHGQR